MSVLHCHFYWFFLSYPIRYGTCCTFLWARLWALRERIENDQMLFIRPLPCLSYNYRWPDIKLISVHVCWILTVPENLGNDVLLSGKGLHCSLILKFLLFRRGRRWAWRERNLRPPELRSPTRSRRLFQSPLSQLRRMAPCRSTSRPCQRTISCPWLKPNSLLTMWR